MGFRMSAEKKSHTGLIIVLLLFTVAAYLLINYLTAMQSVRNAEREMQFGDRMHERQLEEVQRGYERGDYSFKEARDRINKLSDDRKQEIERTGDRYRK